MNVYFVMGIPGSGKSTYIKNRFKDAKVIDLMKFQTGIPVFTPDVIMKSYEECLSALKIACADTSSDIVLEHTMLRKCRRVPYINAVTEIAGIKPDMIVILPEKEIIKYRQEQRNIFTSMEDIQMALDMLEMPTMNEGYNSISIIR